METHIHRMSILEQSDFEGLAKIRSSLELPAADEFVCSNEEVQEVCAAFIDIQETS